MMSDFNSWRTPVLTSHPIMGHKRRPPRRIKQPGRTGVLVTRNRANSRARVQRKAGVYQELAAPLGFRLAPGRRTHLRLAAIPPQPHQSSRVSQLTIARSVPARKCAKGLVEGFRRVGQIADSGVIVSATPNRLLNPAGESPMHADALVHRGIDPSGPCRRVPAPLVAWGITGGTTNGRLRPLQNVPSKAWATAKRVRTPRPLRVVRIPVQPRLGTHSCSRPGGLSGHRNGRQTPIQAQPIWQEPRRLSGLSEATFLGPIGFDTELMGHRACSRRSFRLDQMSNSNCERQRNRRNRASGVSRRWARSPSISAASSHGLAGSNPASNRRDIAGGGGADPLASTAVEASRPYLDQACERRWLVGFVDRGSIPRGSTSSSPPRSLIRGRATSVNVELIT